MNPDLSTTANFVGGTSFATNGLDLSRDTGTVGGELKLMDANNWELSADYDFEFRSDYTANTGILKVGYKW